MSRHTRMSASRVSALRTCGMMPVWLDSFFPIIVYDFPEPVCKTNNANRTQCALLQDLNSFEPFRAVLDAAITHTHTHTRTHTHIHTHTQTHTGTHTHAHTHNTHTHAHTRTHTHTHTHVRRDATIPVRKRRCRRCIPRRRAPASRVRCPRTPSADPRSLGHPAASTQRSAGSFRVTHMLVVFSDQIRGWNHF